MKKFTILLSIFLIFLLNISDAAVQKKRKAKFSLPPRFTQEEVDALVKKTSENSTIPLISGPHVRKRLNLLIGNKRGREAMKDVLSRMQKLEYLPVLLKENELPMELMAVPMLESGYRNISGGGAAGIWAFMRGTARRFGLTVTKKNDERYNTEKLTGAAIKYFKTLKNISEFQNNWHLIMMAYNAGEMRILKAVRTAKTTDTKTLLEKPKLVPSMTKKYIEHFMAYIIILKNPDLLEG